MARREPVGYIRQPYNSSSGDEYRPEFIQCVDGREPQIHEVWNFGEDGATREVHSKSQVDVRAGFVGKFATDYLTPSWRRIPMFGLNSINGIFQWLGVTDLPRTDGPPMTDDLLAPGPSWGDGGTTTNTNGGSEPGGPYVRVAIPWSRLVRVIPAYICSIPENTRSATYRVRGDLLRYNCTTHMQSIYTCRIPIRGRMVNRWHDNCDDLWDEPDINDLFG